MSHNAATTKAKGDGLETRPTGRLGPTQPLLSRSHYFDALAVLRGPPMDIRCEYECKYI